MREQSLYRRGGWVAVRRMRDGVQDHWRKPRTTAAIGGDAMTWRGTIPPPWQISTALPPGDRMVTFLVSLGPIFCPNGRQIFGADSGQSQWGSGIEANFLAPNRYPFLLHFGHPAQIVVPNMLEIPLLIKDSGLLTSTIFMVPFFMPTAPPGRRVGTIHSGLDSMIAHRPIHARCQFKTLPGRYGLITRSANIRLTKANSPKILRRDRW